LEDTVNPQSIRNHYTQALKFVCVPRHLKHMLTDGAALFHLAVKELFRSLIALNCRMSLKNQFEILDNIIWVSIFKPFLKLRFQTIQDSTLNYGVLILPSEVNILYFIGSISCRWVTQRCIQHIGQITSCEDNPQIAEPIREVASIVFQLFFL